MRNHKGDNRDNKTSKFKYDPLIKLAVDIVLTEGKMSASLLQRKLQIDLARAQKLIRQLKYVKFIGPQGETITIEEAMKSKLMKAIRQRNKELNNPVDTFSKLVSQMSLQEIYNLTDDQILNMVMQKPGHPGVFGFKLKKNLFPSKEHFKGKLKALVLRLRKVKDYQKKLEKKFYPNINH